jgi:hypothetical protein
VFDLVALNSGDRGIIIGDGDQLRVRTPASDVLVGEEEIVGIVPSVIDQVDARHEKICIGDRVLFAGEERTVLAQAQDAVFMVERGEVVVARPKEIEVALTVTRQSGSIIGTTVKKVYRNADKSEWFDGDTFEIIEVSPRGHIRVTNRRDPEDKFKFVDHGKIWRYSHEVRGVLATRR